MKYILQEPKFILQEKYILVEKINPADYPNIIKFYPDAATKDSSWASAKLPDVSKFDKYMKRRLEGYFAAEWITREHCDALIVEASKVKAGRNFTGVDKLYKQFETTAKEIAALFTEVFTNLGTAKTTVVEYYEKLKTELLEARENSKTDADEFVKLVSNFIPSIATITDVATVQVRVKAFTEQVENSRFFKAITDDAFTSAFNTLKDKCSVDVTDEAIKKTLKNDITKNVEELKQLIEGLRDKTLNALMDTATLESLKTTTEDLIKLLPQCETIAKEEEKKATALEPLAAFKTLIADLNAFMSEEITTENAEKKATDTIDKFKVFIESANNKLKEIVETSGITIDRSGMETEEETAEESPLSDTNWDREFRNAIDKDTFWASYLRRAWSGNEIKLNPILKAIKLECTNYGFKEGLNPFLDYIKKYYLNTEYGMTPQVYFAVHDAVVRKYIDATDLIESKNKLRSQDVIFCKNFARKSGKDALDYLSLQKDLVQAVSKIDVESEELAILKQNIGEEILVSKDLKKLHFAIMYDVGDLTKEETKITSYDADTKNLRLRPHQDIQLLIAQLGGEVTKDITDPQIVSYVAEIKDAGEAVETFIAIAVQYVDKSDKFIKKYKETASMVSVAIDKMVKIKSDVEKLGAVNEANAIKILDKIAAKFKFTKTKG